jgi:hypothetical protein
MVGQVIAALEGQRSETVEGFVLLRRISLQVLPGTADESWIPIGATPGIATHIHESATEATARSRLAGAWGPNATPTSVDAVRYR